MPLSANRIDGFTAELKKYPEIVFHDTIASLVAAVDAVMILSVDGRIHLEQARQVPAGPQAGLHSTSPLPRAWPTHARSSVSPASMARPSSAPRRAATAPPCRPC